MKTLRYNKFFIIGNIFFMLFFFILNVYTPLIADDYSYSLGVHSIGDIFKYQYNLYLSWSGRNVAHFIAQLWLLAGKSLFNIANTIVYCVFIFLVQFHITGSIKKPNPGLFLIINIFFWFFVPVWGQNFLWLIGSCNYLWTTTVILFFLVPFRKKQDDPDYKWNLPFSILFFLVGILAGWSNENSGSAILLLMIAYYVIKSVRKNKFALFEIFGTIGFLIGFSLLIAAPGNYVRTEAIRQLGWGYSNDPLLLMLIKRFVSVTIIFIKNHGLLFLLISLFFGFDLLCHQKRKLHIFSYFYFLAVLAGTYSMVLSPVFPDRAFLIVTVFSVITLGNILRQTEITMPAIFKRNIRNIGFFAVLAVICLSASFLPSSRQIMAVYLRWYDRVEYILAEKEKGNLAIVTRPIFTSDNHVALYGLEDIYDKNSWTNVVIASYFGLQSIESNNEPMEILWLEKRKRIRQIITPPWKIIKRLRN
jgi:hypothetical protein